MELGHVRARTARALVAVGVGSILLVAGPAAAGAQTDCDDADHAGISTDCVTTTTGDPSTTTTRPPHAEDPPTEYEGLAFTGADLAGLATIGGGIAACGVTFAAAGRRRRYAESESPASGTGGDAGQGEPRFDA